MGAYPWRWKLVDILRWKKCSCLDMDCFVFVCLYWERSEGRVEGLGWFGMWWDGRVKDSLAIVNSPMGAWHSRDGVDEITIDLVFSIYGFEYLYSARDFIMSAPCIYQDFLLSQFQLLNNQINSHLATTMSRSSELFRHSRRSSFLFG